MARLSWIVDIDSSKGIYLGVMYGYNDLEALFEISDGLKNDLHDDMIAIIVEFTMELAIKEWILEPLAFMNIADNYHVNTKKYNQWLINHKRYNKWVTNIVINDFDDDLSQIIDRYGMDQIDENKIWRCFKENDVSYRWLEHHSRGEFVQLLRALPYGFSAGKSSKIYREFSQYAEIVIML